MSDPYLVYLFKLAEQQGIITDYTDATCDSGTLLCSDCPADLACTFIKADTNTYEEWLTNYHIFYARADFSQSTSTILDQHPEILI